MGKEVFVKFVSEPKNDQIKSIVGLACAAQAIEDGHNVSVFFAAAGTRLLDAYYIQELDKEMGQDSTVVAGFMEKITTNGPHQLNKLDAPPPKSKPNTSTEKQCWHASSRCQRGGVSRPSPPSAFSSWRRIRPEKLVATLI